MVLHPAAPIASKEIETQTILRRQADLEQAQLQRRPLCRINIALEHRILHPLPEVQTRARDAVQSLLPGRRLRRDVIRYEYEDNPSSTT